MIKSFFRSSSSLILLVFFLQQAQANGLLEDSRISEKVLYPKGWVEINCKKECKLTVSLYGKNYEFDEARIGIKLVPDHLRMFYDNKTRFTIETESVCDSYSDAPPTYYCISGITINDGKVELITQFKRTESDDYEK